MDWRGESSTEAAMVLYRLVPSILAVNYLTLQEVL